MKGSAGCLNSRVHVVGGVRRAVLLGRPGRFFVELLEGGRRFRCHLHDPGRLSHLMVPGLTAYYRRVLRPGRRTECDLVAVDNGSFLVLADSRLPNPIYRGIAEACGPGFLEVVQEYRAVASRMDFLLVPSRGPPRIVEVKGCNLVVDGVALFPDAPSRRARRHLEDLAYLASKGYDARLSFIVLRPDARVLRPHRLVDPEFSRAMCAYSRKVSYEAFRVGAVHTGGLIEVYYLGPVEVDPCG